MKLLFFTLLFFPYILNAQFLEAWNYPDLSTQTNWTGDLEKFKIYTTGKLQLDAPEATSDAYISRLGEAINNAKWQFGVSMDFNPSASNYMKVYLVSSTQYISENTEAYYVMIGNTEDEISLWKLVNGVNTKIIDGLDKIIAENTNDISITVERDAIGNWNLSGNVNGIKIDALQVFDDEIKRSSYFGLYCKYTSTRSAKMWFEGIEVEGDAFVDDEKPYIKSHTVINGTTIQIIFNESIILPSELSDLFVLPHQIEVESYTIDSNILTLKLNDYLPDTKDGSITIKGIQDLFGNTMDEEYLAYSYNRITVSGIEILNSKALLIYFSQSCELDSLPQIISNDLQLTAEFNSDTSLLLNSANQFTSDFNYDFSIDKIYSTNGDVILPSTIQFNYYQPKRYDVVFNEIMIDPSPSMGLAEEEYIELFNNTDKEINLKGWTLYINDKENILSDFIILPNQYLLLVDNEGAYVTSDNIIGVSSMPSLNNTSGEIVLKHREGLVVDAIRYPFAKKEDTFKNDGGWSVERVDVNNYQNYGDNWCYSTALNGGTPAAQNSMFDSNPDHIYPSVKNIAWHNDTLFSITFSEAMELEAISELKVANIESYSISFDSVFMDRLDIHIEQQLIPNEIHSLKFENQPTDLAMNKLLDLYKLRLAVPVMPDSLDIIFNEILFNPYTEGSDFVEVFNKSNKVFNLDSLKIARLNADGVPDKLYSYTDNGKLFFPGDHLVICIDSSTIKSQYRNVDAELLIETSIPSLPDDGGDIVLCNYRGEVIDAFSYTEDMHFALLSDNEGVSLERISYTAHTNDVNNWHSASGESGYGTPTKVNSQMLTEAISDSEKNFWLTEQEFSPNSDGHNDVLQINYNVKDYGWMASICIYDDMGRLVDTLIDGDLMAPNGFVTWDGTDANHYKSQLGIYIVFIHFYHPDGRVKIEKLVAVLTAGAI